MIDRLKLNKSKKVEKNEDDIKIMCYLYLSIQFFSYDKNNFRIIFKNLILIERNFPYFSF